MARFLSFSSCGGAVVSKSSLKVSTVSAQMKRQMMKKHLTSKFLYFSFSGLGGYCNEGSGPCDSHQPWCMFSNLKRHYFKESCMCVSAHVRVWKPDSLGSSWLMDGVCHVSLTEHLCIYFLLVLFFQALIEPRLSNHTLTQDHTVGHPGLNPVCVFLFCPEDISMITWLAVCTVTQQFLYYEIFNQQLCNEL